MKELLSMIRLLSGAFVAVTVVLSGCGSTEKSILPPGGGLVKRYISVEGGYRERMMVPGPAVFHLELKDASGNVTAKFKNNAQGGPPYRVQGSVEVPAGVESLMGSARLVVAEENKVFFATPEDVPITLWEAPPDEKRDTILLFRSTD
jgi:hypothetical protein